MLELGPQACIVGNMAKSLQSETSKTVGKRMHDLI